MFIFGLQTIWLFASSDLKTIVCPSAVFGTVSTLSGLACKFNESQPMLDTLARVPLAALWPWINLLPFVIDNQHQPDAVLKENVNKPWRPLPSRRLTPRGATY